MILDVYDFLIERDKIVPLDTPRPFKGGLVKLDNMGVLHESKTIPKDELYERAFFYNWSWGRD